MYYVWKGDYKLVDQFSFFEDEPVGLDIFSFQSGEIITVDLPVYELVTSPSYPTKLSDLLLTEFGLHIISPRLVQIFDRLSIKNVQLFPVRIKNHETGEFNDEYKILNVIGAIDCLDFDSAEFSRSRGSGEIVSLEEYKLLPDKISAYSDDESNTIVFRLGEFNWHLLVHKKFRDECEKDNITGCVFTPTEEFV